MDVTVKPRGSDLNTMLAMFDLDDGRYHVWFNPTTMQLTAPILYKNPKVMTRGSEGHFDTRRLNANVAKNAKLITQVLRVVVERKLVEAATQEIRDEVAIQTRTRYIDDIVRIHWVTAMHNAGDFISSIEKITEDEFIAGSARLADRL